MRADFYHLTDVPIERVVPSIAERVLSQNERLVIVSGIQAQLRSLDALLWNFKPESFVPHGRGGDQPILLTTPENAGDSKAENIALVDGAWRDLALGYNRAFYFFDGNSIAEARAAWRALADRDAIERHYWKQDERGKWVEGP